MPLQFSNLTRINMGNKIVKELRIYNNINKKYPYDRDIRELYVPYFNYDDYDAEIIEEIYKKALGDNLKRLPPLYYIADNEYILKYRDWGTVCLFYYSKTGKWRYDDPIKVLQNENPNLFDEQYYKQNINPIYK